MIRGLPRFPCTVDKRPLTPQGFYNAKAGVDDSSWALVGIPTGAVSGFDVIDVVNRSGFAGGSNS
jgi:hypothetical protein